MRNLLLATLSLSIVFFTGCSSKKVFEPEETGKSWGQYKSMGDDIIDITSTAALLDNRKVLGKKTNIDIEIAENYRLIAHTDGWVISATIDGKMKLQSVEDTSKIEELELKKTIASASIQDDILAIVFADNELGLYSISSKEFLMKEKVSETLAIDSRIASPYFVGGVVIFPTLDGKVIIINPTTKKRLRTTIVSSEDNFNNILYFNIIEEKVIAATAHKIISMDKKEARAKYEIRNIAFNGENLFVATKQGEVISLTPTLELNAKLKFPFAHFLGLIAKDDKVYILEKEGYLIVASKDLSSYTIHSVSLDEGFVFVTDKGFFVHDELISIE
ncbi:MAG: hypothetical protein ACI9TV_002048 [Sulfurimonas sp.]|uniref:hypothetical protein n=1 Tax=Sulfurimonas sp. TaxID=2022749 RepID=UPI0039E3DCA4